MRDRVLYLGDGTIDLGAVYLAGTLNRNRVAFEYIESERAVGEAAIDPDTAGFILSDFPASQFNPAAASKIVSAVQRGSGLLMVGGWSSFHGLYGHYDRSPFAPMLPVEISDDDDRINWPYPALMRKEQDHEILAGLPFDVPPSIGGLNRVTARPGSHTLLSAALFRPRRDGTGWSFDPALSLPLLVVGQYHAGRTACYMSDFAPHWCGGSVDWGDTRLSCKAGSRTVEVGNHYATLIGHLVRWVSRLPGTAE